MVSRIFLLCLFLALGQAAAQADPAEAMRQAAKDGDTATALSILQATRESAALHQAFEPFATSDPAVRALAVALNESAPTAPEAMLVRALTLMDDAEAVVWGARPESAPEAFAKRDALLAEAVALLDAASAARPDLAPADTARLRALALTGDATKTRAALDQAMLRAPSYDALAAALPALLPGDEANITALRDLCSAHAAALSGDDRMTSDECVMHFNTALELGGPLDLIADMVIFVSPNARLAAQKATRYIDNRDFSPEALPAIEAYFKGPGREDYERAAAYDEFYGRHHGHVPQRFVTLQNRVARIEVALTQDPMEPQLLWDWARAKSELTSPADTETERAAHKAELVETYTTLTSIAPYSADAWYGLAWAVMSPAMGPDTAKSTLYFARYIHLKGYHHGYISPVLGRQINVYEQTAQMMWRLQNNTPLPTDTPVDVAELDAALTCPAILNLRLAIRSCTRAGLTPEKCFERGLSLQRAFGFADVVYQRGACRAEFTEPDDALDAMISLPEDITRL